MLIDNWHFVRDNVSRPRLPACTEGDCSVSFKLSSSVFKSESPVADSSEFSFDRNGASIPYEAFRTLIDNSAFMSYLEKVKQQFEADTDTKVWSDDDADESEKTSNSGAKKKSRSEGHDQEENVDLFRPHAQPFPDVEYDVDDEEEEDAEEEDEALKRPKNKKSKKAGNQKTKK